MSDFVIDRERTGRTGIGEAVLCEWKSSVQIEAIVADISGRLLLTRLGEDKYATLSQACRARLDYDPLSRSAVVGGPHDAPLAGGAGVVCAGTSDLPVAREAARTLAFHGFSAPIVADVGVAGLWRLMSRLDEIRTLDVVIAVAGMEGALFSVLAGLVEAPIVAVPTSVGYGASAGGVAALSSALASCAPGVVTVNIDNGFGAACAAIKMLRRRR